MIEDHTREYKTEDGAGDPEGVSIVMKKDEDDGEDIIDMSPAGYNELEKYVKRALKITPRTKVKLVCLVPYGDNL
eukprot:5570522-Prymnesium_polylepis.1